METPSDWRFWAKIVAICDMIISIIGIVAFVGNLAWTIYDVLYPPVPNQRPPLVLEQFLLKCFGMVGVMLLIGINLLVAYQLLRSTEIGRNPAESLKLAKVWRVVTIVFLILVCVVNIIYIHPFVCLVIGLIFLYVGHYYIKELNELVPSKTSASSETV